MTDAAKQQTETQENPLHQLQQQFVTFTNIFNGLVNIIHNFPIDNLNKTLITKDFQDGFNHIEKYLNHVAQQMVKPQIVGLHDVPSAQAKVSDTASTEPETAA